MMPKPGDAALSWYRQNLPAKCERCRRCGFDPRLGVSLSRKWQPTPVSLPWKIPGTRVWQVAVWGLYKESDMHSTHRHTMIYIFPVVKYNENTGGHFHSKLVKM